VQNRWYASQGWDRHMRQFCTANDIAYQGFSLLTANRATLGQPALAQIARRHGRTTSQVVFRFALDIGVLPLTGTTSPDHMREDLDVLNFHLDANEIAQIERLT
jgi:diketogulonate reductase-like aldo/keto reductase